MDSDKIKQAALDLAIEIIIREGRLREYFQMLFPNGMIDAQDALPVTVVENIVKGKSLIDQIRALRAVYLELGLKEAKELIEAALQGSYRTCYHCGGTGKSYYTIPAAVLKRS